MADNEDIFDTLCFTLLCVTSVCILMYKSDFDTLIYLSLALLSQSQYGLWTLVTKGVNSNTTGYLASVSEMITFYFNLPLIAAQTCLLSFDVKHIDGVTPSTALYVSLSPLACIALRLVSRDRPVHGYANEVVKFLSLALLVYVTYELGYPLMAIVFGLVFYLNERSYVLRLGQDRASLLAFNSVLYVWWLSQINALND